MARVRSSGGTTGSVWGLVIFGAGFFICLILAILFYTQIETAKQSAEDAKSDLADVINSAQAGNTTISELKNNGESGTVVGKLLTEIENLRTTVRGLQGENQKVAGELDLTKSNLDAQVKAVEQAQADMRQARNDKAELEKQLNAKVAQLDGRISNIDTGVQNLNRTSTEQVSTLEKSFDEERKKLQAQIDERDSQIFALQNTIAELNTSLTEAIGIRGGLAAPAVTQPDARIVAQIPDQNKVYLDIGRDANLRLGMSFSVFDPDELIKVEGEDLAEGKAIVEVISVDSTSAVARVVRSKPRVKINDGDILVNVAYDPNRVYNFFVFGQFDLDTDGETSPQDKNAVEGMVTRFGGRLVDTLGYSTDYMIVGIEPDYPTAPLDQTDLIAMNEYSVALKNYQAYLDTIAEAKEFDIPILSQNRFVELVGYFER